MKIFIIISVVIFLLTLILSEVRLYGNDCERILDTDKASAIFTECVKNAGDVYHCKRSAEDLTTTIKCKK